MSDGELNVYPYGIEIVDNPPYTFTTNITGGTIRTEGAFINHRADFNPVGGTLEFYGSEDAGLSMSAGSLWDLTVDKSTDAMVAMTGSTFISNKTRVSGGTFQLLPDAVLFANSHAYVYENGTLWIREGAAMKIDHAHELDIVGGTLKVHGLPTNLASIIRIGDYGSTNVAIREGGTISARNAYFANLTYGVFVFENGWVDPDNAFTNCTFENGYYSLLKIENNQDLVITNAHFPSTSAPYNVKKIVDQGTVTFVNASGSFSGSAFEDDPFNRIFWGDETVEQIIALPAGWSGISSYIIPDDATLVNIFAPVQDELVILQNFDGMYWPSASVNTLGNWDDHAGYQIKMETAQQITFSGAVQGNLTANLSEGWNYLPVLNACDNSSEVLFSEIAANLQIVKEIAGPNVYWPQFGINTLHQIEPGKAYFVLVDEDVEVEFPECASKSSTLTDASTLSGQENHKNLTESLDLTEFGISTTPITHTIAILPSALKGFEQGTIIGAYDQAGNCFGASVYNSDFISLTAFGNDPTTAEKDGFFEGEMILFKNLSGLTNLTGLEPTFDQNIPQSDGLFSENGLSAITGFEEATGIGYDGFGSSISIYPNPTNGVVNITGLNTDDELTITNVKGQTVIKEINHSNQLMTIDLSGHQPGVYFINIQHNKQNIFRKVALR
jgi:hypothetical protein